MQFGHVQIRHDSSVSFFFRLTKRIIVHVIWNYYQLSRPFEQALKTLLQCFLGNRAACVKHKGLHSNNKKSKKSY